MAGAIGLSVVAAVVLVDVYTVAGHSMQPGLDGGDRIVVASWRSTDLGDVVVVRVRRVDRTTEHVKRVVGVAGDELRDVDCVLFRNGRTVDEPYVADPNQCGGGFDALVVPADHVFVLGDRREASQDSRAIGPVHADDVLGAVVWAS